MKEKNGSDLQVVFKRVLVVSDNPERCATLSSLFACLPLQKLRFAISPFSDPGQFDSSLEVRQTDLRDSHTIRKIGNDFDLIFSIHCKQLFPSELVNNSKCINIHPGYNPTNRGWFPQVFSILHGHVLGATIHEIDEQLDHGPIIARKLVPVFSWDTSFSAYNRVLECETLLLERNLKSIIANDYETFTPSSEEIENLYLKKDFNELCHLDLDETLTMAEAINRLRALTHGNYKNAYFFDPESSEKIYVSVDLSKK